MFVQNCVKSQKAKLLSIFFLRTGIDTPCRITEELGTLEEISRCCSFSAFWMTVDIFTAVFSVLKLLGLKKYVLHIFLYCFLQFEIFSNDFFSWLCDVLHMQMKSWHLVLSFTKNDSHFIQGTKTQNAGPALSTFY